MESSDHRAEPVLGKRFKRSHTLLRDVLPPLETLFVTVEGTGETEGIFTLKNALLESTKIGVLKGEILSRAELMIERDEANYLLAEADAMTQDLLREMRDTQGELSEAHEFFATLNSHEGGKIDELSSRQARRKIRDIAESVSKALHFLPSYGLTPDSLKVQISAGKGLSIALSPDSDSTDSCINLKVLFILDKYGMSDSFYHDLASIFPELTRCHRIKKTRIELNHR